MSDFERFILVFLGVIIVILSVFFQIDSTFNLTEGILLYIIGGCLFLRNVYKINY